MPADEIRACVVDLRAEKDNTFAKEPLVDVGGSISARELGTDIERKVAHTVRVSGEDGWRQRAAKGSVRSRARAVGALLAAGGASVAMVAAASGPPAAASTLRAARAIPASFDTARATRASFNAVQTWTTRLPGIVAQSSPTAATIAGVPAVVVGTRSGQVEALRLTNGRSLPGWPVKVPGGYPVDSTPSTAAGLVFVGTGDAAVPHGGYLALRGNGSVAWYRTVSLLPGGGGGNAGVSASLAYGTLNGKKTVVAGTLGQQEGAFAAAGGAARPGFPWFSSDTEFSTPAIANLYGNGRNYIVGGAEQTAGLSYEHHYSRGGHLRVLSGTGNAGSSTPAGGAVCDFTPNQGVYSSPAVGRFLSGNRVGIAVGTGNDFPGMSDSHILFGLTSHCGVAWRASLNGATLGSPALVDSLGNGHLQVAEGTENGVAYLIDGANGRPYWATNVGSRIIGSVTSANLGSGYQDLLVPTVEGLWILDGRSGRTVAVLADHAMGLQDAALVTDDPGGHIGITLAGYDVHGGLVEHFDLAGTNGALAREQGAWPMFHHDPQLTGSALPAGRR